MQGEKCRAKVMRIIFHSLVEHLIQKHLILTLPLILSRSLHYCYKRLHSAGEAFQHILNVADEIYIHSEKLMRLGMDIGWSGLAYSQHSNSCQRLVVLRSGFCAGQLSTLDSVNHFSRILLVSEGTVMSNWWHKFGIIQFSTMPFYIIALRVSHTATKGPNPNHENKSNHI